MTQLNDSIIFNEPSAVYHASKAIGSGSIRAYLRSPRLFHDYQMGLRPASTDALCFGIASHTRLLEPELFATTCAIKPDGLSFATKEGKAWREQQAGKQIVSFDDAKHLQHMHDRMPTEVRDIFASCKKEVTVRTVTDTGLSIQCRPDLWDIEGKRKFDLKTINAIEAIDGAIFKRSYHVQVYWYSYIIGLVTGSRPKIDDLIFVEKQPPYRWRIVSLDYDYQCLALDQIGIALRGIAERTKSGVWSESDDELRTVASPPDYATEYIDTTNTEEE